MIAALALAAAAPSGLTVQEALNLTTENLIARVLGSTGHGYREVRRPYLGGLPGRIGFSLDFASAPYPTPYAGLCAAEIVSVYFWPREGNPDPNQPMTEHGRLHLHLYAYVGNLEQSAASPNRGRPPSVGACARAGPVLSSDDRLARRTKYFGGNHPGEADWPAIEAHVALHALAALVAAARTGHLPASSCESDGQSPTSPICQRQQALLANLPLTRLNGFNIAPCDEVRPQLCITAGFSPDPDPSSNRVLTIRIETGAVDLDIATVDVSARRVQIEEGAIVN